MSKVGKAFCFSLVVSVFCFDASSRNLVVGLPMLEPYASQRSGVLSGIYVDILRAVFRDMGENCVIRVMPPARTLHEFMSGDLDVTVFVNNSPMLSRVAHFTRAPLASYRAVLMGREDNSIGEKASALPVSTSIAVIRGFSSTSRFIQGHEVTLVNSREQLLKMLFSGRVDYILAEDAVTGSFALQRDFPPLYNVLLLENQSVFTAFSRFRLGADAESLGRRFDASLQQLVLRGGLHAILKKHTKGNGVLP